MYLLITAFHHWKSGHISYAYCTCGSFSSLERATIILQGLSHAHQPDESSLIRAAVGSSVRTYGLLFPSHTHACSHTDTPNHEYTCRCKPCDYMCRWIPLLHPTYSKPQSLRQLRRRRRRRKTSAFMTDE